MAKTALKQVPDSIELIVRDFEVDKLNPLVDLVCLKEKGSVGHKKYERDIIGTWLAMAHVLRQGTT